MQNDKVAILHFDSDDPRGQLLDLLRFVKGQLRDIEVAASEHGDVKTVKLCGRSIAANERIWNNAIHCGDRVERNASGRVGQPVSEFTEDTIFDLAVRRDWGWLRENWRSILPSGRQ